MSKSTYRARLTTKKGAYRVREFASLKNAIRWAKQQVINEGCTGYIEESYMTPGFNGMLRTIPRWHHTEALEAA